MTRPRVDLPIEMPEGSTAYCITCGRLEQVVLARRLRDVMQGGATVGVHVLVDLGCSHSSTVVMGAAATER